MPVHVDQAVPSPAGQGQGCADEEAAVTPEHQGCMPGVEHLSELVRQTS